jgi:hypothetical protein
MCAGIYIFKNEGWISAGVIWGKKYKKGKRKPMPLRGKVWKGEGGNVRENERKGKEKEKMGSKRYLKKMQNMEELRKKGPVGVKKWHAVRGGKVSFWGGGA